MKEVRAHGVIPSPDFIGSSHHFTHRAEYANPWSVTPQKPKIERLGHRDREVLIARSARDTLVHFAELSRAATTLIFLASSPSASAIAAPYDFQRVFVAFATRKGPQWVGRPI